ncbi:MAG TPA: cupin domain-containing protein [Candidatus Binatia bacterium]|nr:cupin domain-containing protein [Candidatus Binatia bacterium]
MPRPVDIPTVTNLDRDKLVTYPLDGPEYEALLRWLPITYDAKTMRGSYYFQMLPGAVTKPHAHPGYEEFLVLEGTAIESDGRVLNTGDFVSFKPGSFHNTRTETGCLMIVFGWDNDARG